jgi:hypothetical protein
MFSPWLADVKWALTGQLVAGSRDVAALAQLLWKQLLLEVQMRE